MPPKKIFATPEEAAEYVQELRRRNREQAKHIMIIKLKLIPKSISSSYKNARNLAMIIITRTRIYMLKFKKLFSLLLLY